jgi:hypothetical protein
MRPCALVYVATLLFCHARIQSEWENSSPGRRETSRMPLGWRPGPLPALKGLEEDSRPEEASETL